MCGVTLVRLEKMFCQHKHGKNENKEWKNIEWCFLKHFVYKQTPIIYRIVFIVKTNHFNVAQTFLIVFCVYFIGMSAFIVFVFFYIYTAFWYLYLYNKNMFHMYELLLQNIKVGKLTHIVYTYIYIYIYENYRT